MELFPVLARAPARKHVLAGAVALVSVGLMLIAVLGTAGLPTPFNAGSSARVRTGPVEADGVPETTTTVAAQVAGVVTQPEDVARGFGPSPTAAAARATTTTTAPPAPTTSTTIPDPNDLLDGLGLRSDLFEP
jgi:hypothetical protein